MPNVVIRIGHVANRKQSLVSLRGVFSSQKLAEEAPKITGEQYSYYNVPVDEIADIGLARYDPTERGTLTFASTIPRDVSNAAADPASQSGGQESLGEQDHDES